MSKYRSNVVVDVGAFVTFVFLTATGALMRFVLPPGSGHFMTLWGMDRHEWGQIHFWIAMVFIGLLTLHLFLHWSWIVGIFRGETGKTTGIRFALAMAAVLAIIGLAVAMLCAPVENTGEPPHKIRSGEQPANPTFEIDGSMTLHEVEQRTGVPAAVILKELGLPSDLPTDERLGKLRKKHDFKIHDIQNIVQKHLNQQ